MQCVSVSCILLSKITHIPVTLSTSFICLPFKRSTSADAFRIEIPLRSRYLRQHFWPPLQHQCPSKRLVRQAFPVSNALSRILLDLHFNISMLSVLFATVEQFECALKKTVRCNRSITKTQEN